MAFSSECIEKIQNIGNTLVDISCYEEYRSEAIGQISTLFSASAAVFFHYADSEKPRENMSKEDLYFSGMEDSYRDLYISEVRSTDPLSLWYWRPGRNLQATALSSIIPPGRLQCTSLYKKIQIPNNNYDILAIPLVVRQRLLGTISITRPAEAANFNQYDIQVARLLAPTLSATYCNLVQADELAEIRRTELAKDGVRRSARFSIEQNTFGLSKREQEILEKIFEGLNSTEVGKCLCISQWTVKNHLQSIYRKVGVNNRINLLKKLSQCDPFVST